MVAGKICRSGRSSAALIPRRNKIGPEQVFDKASINMVIESVDE
jgi:hypothetical protein